MADFLSTLFSGGAQEEAAQKNAAALTQYGDTANSALTSTYGTGVGNLNQAIGAYAPLSTLANKYNAGGDLYLDALGVNGPQGNTRAQGAFQNAPGYTGAVTAGTDAIQRQLGASGMSQSGNSAEDVGTFVQNLQNQQYNTWLQNLQQTGQTGVALAGNVAQGQAGGYTNLANLASQYGQNQAGVAGNVASGTMADNNMVAAGQAAGAKNLLGAGLSLATLAATGGMSGLAGMAGGALMSGGLGSALGGEYGGTASNVLPGLSAEDYGQGAKAGGLMDTWGLGG